MTLFFIVHIDIIQLIFYYTYCSHTRNHCNHYYDYPYLLYDHMFAGYLD